MKKPSMSSGRIRRSWHKSLQAARRNVLPGSILLVFGVLLVVAYYYVPAVHRALGNVVRWREQLGVLFPILSTAFFAGLFPLVVRRIFLGAKESVGGVVFSLLFWAEKGWEVNLLYNIQAHVWGDDTELLTLVAKVATDQLIYVPFVAVPTMTLGYLWKDSGFSLQRMRGHLREKGYIERMLPVLISNLVIWIPAVSIIYSFPLPLQLPLQNIILSIFVLLVVFLAANETEDEAVNPPPAAD